MALKKSNKYGYEVTTRAKEYPNCYATIKANLHCTGVLGFAILTVILGVIGTDVKTYSQELPRGTHASSSWGLIRYVHSNANVRSSRSSESNIVGQLKTGQKIKADFLKANWYAIFKVDEAVRSEKNAIGYVYAPLLKPNSPSKTKIAKRVSDILKYKILAKQDYSYSNTPRMKFTVILDVDKLPSEKQMKKTAEHIWRNGNKGWKEFTVFCFLPGMDTKWMAYGTATFTPKGLKDFRIMETALFGTKWQK